jgi:hypothetical protein
MISEKDAESIAIDLLGRQPDDGSRPWGLTEFDHGWLIVDLQPPDEPRRGGASRVIERDAGRLMRFPSSISRRRIMEQYPDVRDRGHEVRPSGP